MYEHLAPVTRLGGTVTLKLGLSRKATPLHAALKMGIRSQIRVSVGLALMCSTVSNEDMFFIFILDEFCAGLRVACERRPKARSRNTAAGGTDHSPENRGGSAVGSPSRARAAAAGGGQPVGGGGGGGAMACPLDRLEVSMPPRAVLVRQLAAVVR